jgi:hypothetical protein
MWKDGAFICILEDENGEPSAQVIKQNNGTWAVYDPRRMNEARTGPLRVAGGFPTSEAAKQFVDEARAGSTSEGAAATEAAPNYEVKRQAPIPIR